MNLSTNIDIILLENKRLSSIEQTLSNKISKLNTKQQQLYDIIQTQSNFLLEFERALGVGVAANNQFKEDLKRVRNERDYWKSKYEKLSFKSSTIAVDASVSKKDESHAETLNNSDMLKLVAENASLRQQQVMLIRTMKLLYAQANSCRNTQGNPLRQDSQFIDANSKVPKDDDSASTPRPNLANDNSVYQIVMEPLKRFDEQIESIEKM